VPLAGLLDSYSDLTKLQNSILPSDAFVAKRSHYDYDLSMNLKLIYELKAALATEPGLIWLNNGDRRSIVPSQSFTYVEPQI
jgi:hypothetical protein